MFRRIFFVVPGIVVAGPPARAQPSHSLKNKLAIASNGGDGTATFVHQDGPDAYSVVASVPTQRSARTIAVDPKTHRVYLPAATSQAAPAPTARNPRPRAQMAPGSFTILVLQR